MDSCYTGGHTASDHILTDITTCNNEEPQQKYLLGTVSKILIGAFIFGIGNCIMYDLFAEITSVSHESTYFEITNRNSGPYIVVTLSTAEKFKGFSDRFGKKRYRNPSGNCRLLPLVGCLGFTSPLRQYISLYQAVSQRGRNREERIDKRKPIQTPPSRTHCKQDQVLL